MKHNVVGLLVAGVVLQSIAAAHGGSYVPGGTYGGPKDTTPPAPSGGGPSAPSGPTTPGPSGPSAPPSGPSRPGTPGASTPGAPAGAPGRGPRTGAQADVDLTLWQQWWAMNQAPYLNLKAHIRDGGAITEPEGYLLGSGRKDNARQVFRVSVEKIRKEIVPPLLQALRTESSNDIQSSCMIALAKIGDPDMASDGALVRELQLEIQKRLPSSSQELSETAAVALGIMGSRENIPVLSAVLENDVARLKELGVPQQGNVSVRTRAFAAYGLGLIGHRASDYDRLVINSTLRKLLDGEGRGMAHRDVPAACLTAIGLTPLQVDARELDPEFAAKTNAKDMLDSLQDQVRYLLAYYDDESNNAMTRAQVPTALGRLLRGADIPSDFPERTVVAKALMRSLDDSKTDNSMQQSCILALGVIGDCDEDALDKSIRTALMHVKEATADQQARRFALIALAQAAGQPGKGQGDPIHGVNTRESQENARRYLTGELNGRGPARPWAALALAVLERSLADSMEAASNDSKLVLRTSLDLARSPDELGALSIACGIARDTGAKDILLKHLESVHDIEARGFTAVALGLLDEQTAIAPLTEIARRSKYQADLLRSAAIGLGLLGDKELVPDLIEMLSGATSLSSQAAISKALGTIGDVRSITPLVGLLRSPDATDLARAFGAVALGIVADKEDLPWNAKISVGSNYRANTSCLSDGKSGVLDIL
ncbi:MAG TPA: HEAT repeat domain-containing protein [Planctomycetota bacterium]|nr:HEAT repeat domain-containing protein [Planctomycetota bacterium]